MKQVRFGIIGLGNMGSDHVRWISGGKVARAELTAICDLRQDRLEAAQKVCPSAAAYTDYHELLNSGKVDAVSVSIANGEMFVSTNPKLAVSTVQFDNSQNGNVIGFPKGETELVDAVNKIIDEVLEQGLYDQWLEEATAEAENLGL